MSYINHSFFKKAILLLFMLFKLINTHAQVPGCIDPLARYYNPSATINNGSCIYKNTVVSPRTSVVLCDTLSGTSGLIFWNHQLLTHNDHSDNNIYSIDTNTWVILHKYSVTGPKFRDWEEIAQDSAFIYLGDFGNNANGNRQDLNIRRILKASFNDSSLKADIISFFYSNQTGYIATGLTIPILIAKQ